MANPIITLARCDNHRVVLATATTQSAPDMTDQTTRTAEADALPDRRPRGFTLLELLVVIAILGFLALLVVPKVMTLFSGAKDKIARQSIGGIGTVLDLYKLDVGTYPTTDQGLQALWAAPTGVTNWHGPYVKSDKMLVDPWAHAWIYRYPSDRPGHDYDVCSQGETGQASSTTAICND